MPSSWWYLNIRRDARLLHQRPWPTNAMQHQLLEELHTIEDGDRNWHRSLMKFVIKISSQAELL